MGSLKKNHEKMVVFFCLYLNMSLQETHSDSIKQKSMAKYGQTEQNKMEQGHFVWFWRNALLEETHSDIDEKKKQKNVSLKETRFDSQRKK